MTGTRHQKQYTNISMKGKNYAFKLLLLFGSCQFEFRILQVQTTRKTFENVEKTALFLLVTCLSRLAFFVMPEYQ